MDSKILKYIGIAVAVIGLGTAIYIGQKNSIPYQQQVELVDAKIREQSPDIFVKVGEIMQKTNYTIKAGELAGEVLAQTKVMESGAEITVDVRKVNAHNDRLEPVIGHEIYHIWEAYYVYGGVDPFSQLVANEKPINNWQDRTFEKSAIARENELRRYLKAKYPKEYGTMSSTREAQNKKK